MSETKKRIIPEVILDIENPTEGQQQVYAPSGQKFEFKEGKWTEMQLSPKEILENFLGDVTNRKWVAEVSNVLHDRSRGNWFDIDWMMKKTRFKNISECLEVLNLLKLTGNLVAEMRNQREMYKVSTSIEGQILLLEQQNKEHLKSIDVNNKEIEILRSRL